MQRLALLAVPVLALALVAFGRPQDPAPPEPKPAEAQEASDETDAERLERKVRELLALNGSEEAMGQVLEQMMGQFEGMPGLPEGFLDTFLEMADVDELIDMTVEVWMKHLDEKTLDAAIVYAKSEAGQAFYAAQPAIIQESMELGSSWGQDLAMRVLAELGR